MQLNINGNMTDMPETVKTVSDVKQYFHISSTVVIVEYNGDILNKDRHEKQEVRSGDKIELVQFVGGG
ncbi:hypothetical protein GCM10028778_16020 [Barrientosiimonas marina]|uniref:Sulfur carrier protein ThiS n=1 Tax=Lentibacillus kimchii TaxID=1542911 RepID=A0ABW2UXI5_9BACI